MVEQSEDRFLRFGAGQMRPKTQMPATPERLMMGVFTGDVESIRLRIDRGIVIGGRERRR